MDKFMKFKIASLLIIGVFVTACNPKYYSPNTQNVPLIDKEGETNITVAGNGNQAEFQVAYGISESMALVADGGLFIPPDLDNGNGGSGSFGEIGLGYYKPLENNLVFEVYGLFGLGSVENHLPSTIEANPGTKGDISASIFRVGIQPNFGYKTDNFAVAVSTRIAMLNYSSIEGDLIFDGQNQVDYLNDNKSNFMIEPALTLRGGLEKVKLQLQIGYSLNASNTNFRQDDGFITLGVNFNFD